MTTITELVADLLAGKRRALAKLLSMVEAQGPAADEALAAIFPHTGNAWVIGVTGAPGTGKSSLVSALTQQLRHADHTVGIIAVDPTSPFTGGAILGDRIRMLDRAGDPGVFIRSMATRGSLGGLAITTRDFVRMMDAAGFDYVIVETVGAGQSEVDIVRTAHTTIVVEAPGLGDDIQAIKAGILEIADILIVNKADNPNADRTKHNLEAMLHLGHPTMYGHQLGHHRLLVTDEVKPDPTPPATTSWLPPILKTIATTGVGLPDLVNALREHQNYLTESGAVAQLEARYIEMELYERLQISLQAHLRARIDQNMLTNLIDRIRTRELDPKQAANLLLDTIS